mgnify:CR=1 FL=1
MNLVRAGFVIIQAYRLWAKAYRLRDVANHRLWAKADRLWAEARRLCGFSPSTYDTLWEITHELD